MTDTLPSPILNSFTNSKFKWRTAEGVAKDSRLDISEVVRTLENSAQVVRANSPNKNGKAIYTLRADYLRHEPIVRRLVGALANAPE